MLRSKFFDPNLIQNWFEETLLSIFQALQLRVAVFAQVGPLDPGAVDGDVGRPGRNDLVIDLEEVRVERITWKQNMGVCESHDSVGQ